MAVKIFCSTMFGTKPLFLDTNDFSDYVVINQCEEKSHEKNDFLNYYEKGLSRSRNRFLENANEDDIIIISDNDVRYFDDVYEKVSNAFKIHSEMDVLTFMFMTPEGDFTKVYNEDYFEYNRFNLGKVASIEIAIKMKFFKNNKNIVFDENFGLGAKYPTGEEFIFLSDVLKMGGRIGFVPEIIAYHPKDASGGNFDNSNLIKAKGAMIRRVFGLLLGFPICIYMCLRKFRLSKYSLFNFFVLIISGFFKK